MTTLEFQDELFAIRGKNQRTLTDLDYEAILSEGLEAYNRAASGRPYEESSALKRTFEDFLLLRVAALLRPAAYKDFIEKLVENGSGGDDC